MSGFPQGYFFIKSIKTGKVLDVEGASNKPGEDVVLYHIHKLRSVDNQLWFYENGYIINKKSNLCLDVKGGHLKEVAKIIQYQRKLGQEASNQIWEFQNGFIFPRANPDLVLDIRGDKDKDDAEIILYKRKQTDNHNQLWELVPHN
ncbi:uncharacterized protein VTP21DRAFT_4088 [Calcarisporiella thermophila]|uniref:uncharacterized protein n=1 Tax=Calcarisporiella thermophila TaxID=911321 RepID=UPI003743305B